MVFEEKMKMQSEAEIMEKIRQQWEARKDVKPVVEGSGLYGPDLVLTSADGRKIIIEIKPYSAPDAIDVAHMSIWKEELGAEGAIIASGAKPPISVAQAAEKRHVGILSPNDLLMNIQNQPMQYFFQLGEPRLPSEPPSERALMDIVLTDLMTYRWRSNEAYRQVLVLPNGSTDKIPKRDLEKIIESCTVQIGGYGGPTFPYSRTYPGVTEIHHADGFGVLDDRAWPYEDWSFHYWYFTEYGYFMARRHLSEEHMADIPRGTLGLEWVELDIARALLFARNLQTNVRNYPETRIKFQLHGMKARELIILNRARTPLVGPYIASDDDLVSEVLLAKDGDLVQTGMDMLLNTVWRFGWGNPPEQILRGDIATLISGRFPS
jgi:hypothetical protein